jgi:uncharacterized protein
MTFTLPGIPALDWIPVSGTAELTSDGVLQLQSAGGVDWTNDAGGGPQQHAAAMLGFEASGDFSLSARVRVPGERTTFDAGALAIWGDRDHWAKVCFECSPQGQTMVVSVVTDVFSDDCNSTLVDTDAVYLRVTRTGSAWAFHSSSDGRFWDFVRYFRLDIDGPVRAGFLAQAPLGPTCVALFDEIVYTQDIPSDLRDGS